MPKCRLHDVELKPGDRQIRCGMPPAPPDGYFEIQGSEFPIAYSFEIGGCVLSKDDAGQESVNYCPVCRDAEKAWHSGRGGNEFWRS